MASVRFHGLVARALATCWLSAVALAPAAAHGQYFARPEIDYWNEGGTAPKQRSGEAPPIRWEDYQDPTTEAFWEDGGNYVPPLPLRAAAADPTPENVGNYLRWQRRKIEVLSAFTREIERQRAAEKGIAEQGPGVASALRPPGPVPVASPEADAIRERGEPVDWRRLELVLFYRSDCPHCKASLATVEELEARGATVIPVQVDWQARPPLFPGSVPYTDEISRTEPVDAVPTWIASYRGDRLTMQGKVSVQSIELTLKTAQQQRASSRTGKGG